MSDRPSAALRAAMTAAACAALAVPEARAQAPSPQPPVYVGERWVCRPADAGNAVNTMMANGAQQLRCRPVNVTLTSTDGRVYVVGKPQPDASADAERVSVASPQATTGARPEDVHDSWVEMMKKALVVDTVASNAAPNVGDRWVCRPVDASHPANASMSSAAGAVSLRCRAVNFAMQTSSGQMIVIGRVQAKPPSTNPKDDTMEQTAAMTLPYARGLTIDQMNASWNSYVNRVFDIATSAAGGG